MLLYHDRLLLLIYLGHNFSNIAVLESSSDRLVAHYLLKLLLHSIRTHILHHLLLTGLLHLPCTRAVVEHRLL